MILLSLTDVHAMWPETSRPSQGSAIMTGACSYGGFLRCPNGKRVLHRADICGNWWKSGGRIG